MRINSLMASASLVALVTLGFAAPSFAQTADDSVDEVVVTGIRQSVRTATQIKRNADTVVDSIVAEDIGKLPDVNVSDALQRITGIQIDRDYGEGSSVRIRGLSQIETLLNGREVFTAGGGRAFNYQDLAAELIAGIDVYKAPTADLVEGGIGGTIDVRTHLPFDFRKFTASASVKGRYNDLTGITSPLVSGLISDRWETGMGEMGALISAAYQERDFRNDQIGTGGYSARGNLATGTTNPVGAPATVITPTGAYNPGVWGNRTRKGIDAAFQWRPTDELEFYAQGNYSRFENITRQSGLNIASLGTGTTNAATRFLANVTGGQTNLTLAPGTNIASRVVFADVTLNTFGVSRDTFDENVAYAGGAIWTPGNWKIKADYSHTTSTNHLYYRELDLRTNVPYYVQDNTSGFAEILGFSNSALTTPYNFNDLSNYRIDAVTNSENHYEGTLDAWWLDTTYDFDEGFITQFRGGLRYADREQLFTPNRFGPTAPCNPCSATSTTSTLAPTIVTTATTYPGVAAGVGLFLPSDPRFANLFISNPLSDFYTDGDFTPRYIRDYQVASYAPLENFENVRSQLGFNIFPVTNPLGLFNVNEKTYTAYGTLKFEADIGIPVDGNVGVRVVRTETTLIGTRATFSGLTQTGYVPLVLDAAYTDGLPSANMRFHLSDNLQLRLAASKTLTRPDFSQLSPSITLIPGQGSASAGNPDLKPLRATAYDVSLEYYFGDSNSIFVAAFYRKGTNFISSVTTPDVLIDGVLYRYSFPSNSGADTVIRGIEAGYTQFFDFLPGAFSGLGIQANYSYIKSQSFRAAQNAFFPVTNLSPHSGNLSLIYEKGPITARIAMNWRSDTPTGYSTFVGIPDLLVGTRKSYSVYDASVTYDVNEHIALSLSAGNITRSETENFTGIRELLGSRSLDDVQYTVGARYRY